jgi:hypothetical protein
LRGSDRISRRALGWDTGDLLDFAADRLGVGVGVEGALVAAVGEKPTAASSRE